MRECDGGARHAAALLMVWTLGMSSAAAAQTAQPSARRRACRFRCGRAARRSRRARADEDVPTLTPYYPAKPAPTGTAVIVCPGGSYTRLAMDHEGKQVAEWMNMIGITAFVLKYRLGPKYHHPVMLMDAQRAIRYVRSLAPALKIDAGRRRHHGVLGGRTSRFDYGHVPR